MPRTEAWRLAQRSAALAPCLHQNLRSSPPFRSVDRLHAPCLDLPCIALPGPQLNWTALQLRFPTCTCHSTLALALALTPPFALPLLLFARQTRPSILRRSSSRRLQLSLQLSLSLLSLPIGRLCFLTCDAADTPVRWTQEETTVQSGLANNRKTAASKKATRETDTRCLVRGPQLPSFFLVVSGPARY